jgi:hypothetical protein
MHIGIQHDPHQNGRFRFCIVGCLRPFSIKSGVNFLRLPAILLDESVAPLAQVMLTKSDEESCTGADFTRTVSFDDEYLAMALWRINWKGDGRSGSRRRAVIMLRWRD